MAKKRIRPARKECGSPVEDCGTRPCACFPRAVEDAEPEGFWARVRASFGGVFVGARTAITCLCLALSGIADQFDIIDIISFIRNNFDERVKLGSILIAIAIVFFVLRKLTNGPMQFGASKAGMDEGE